MTIWLTTKEVAAELGITARKVREMCERGELRAVWVGRWRIHPDWEAIYHAASDTLDREAAMALERVLG